MKKFLFILASAAVLFTACSDKGEGDKKPVDPTLSVTPAALEFSAEGDTQVIRITTNQDWVVSVNPASAADWLSLDATSGKAGENLEVEVTADPNEVPEARSATVKVVAGTLTKNVTVSQEAKEVPVVVPPTVDQNTTYKVDGGTLEYADEFVDGGLYVFVYGYDNTKCWTVADNALTMSTFDNQAFTVSQVFECKVDASKITAEIRAMDDYRKLAACALKSVATGKYLKQDFNVNADLADALFIVFANNWGGYTDSGNVGIVDQYRSDSSSSNCNSLWYNTSFEWGENGLYYEGGAGTTKRKSYVYKVVANE